MSPTAAAATALDGGVALDFRQHTYHYTYMELDKQRGGLADEAERPPLTFRLDPSSGVPTYQQIVRQVEHALRMAVLIPGDQLPKVKDVVAELAVNPNTVLKAYRELEIKGLAVGRPGVGTFVVKGLEVVSAGDQQKLQRGMRRWLDQAVGMGLDEAGITALFSAALHEQLRASNGVIAS
jgi:GntR family transcriptional regulator